MFRFREVWLYICCICYMLHGFVCVRVCGWCCWWGGGLSASDVMFRILGWWREEVRDSAMWDQEPRAIVGVGVPGSLCAVRDRPIAERNTWDIFIATYDYIASPKRVWNIQHIRNLQHRRFVLLLELRWIAWRSISNAMKRRRHAEWNYNVLIHYILFGGIVWWMACVWIRLFGHQNSKQDLGPRIAQNERKHDSWEQNFSNRFSMYIVYIYIPAEWFAKFGQSKCVFIY